LTAVERFNTKPNESFSYLQEHNLITGPLPECLAVYVTLLLRCSWRSSDLVLSLSLSRVLGIAGCV